MHRKQEWLGCSLQRLTYAPQNVAPQARVLVDLAYLTGESSNPEHGAFL